MPLVRRPDRLIFFEPLASAYECLQSTGRLASLEALGASITNDPGRLLEFARENQAHAPAILVLPVYQRLFPELESALRDQLANAGFPDAAAHKSRETASATTSAQGPAGAPAPGTTVDRATGGRFLRQWTRNAILRIGDATTPAQAALEFLVPPRSEDDSRSSVHTIESADRSPAPELLYCGAGPQLLYDLGLAPAPTASVRLNRKRTVGSGDVQQQRVEDLRRRFFIVAADTAIAPLLAAGITPDLAISVDSGPGTYYHLLAARQLPGDGTPAGQQRFGFPVLSNLAGSRCLPLFFERCLYYRSTMPLDQWLGEGPLSAIPELNNPSRNAVGLALHIARTLGVRSVKTAGANFQSLGRLTHARGTGYSEFARERLHRLYSIEMYQPGGYATRSGPAKGGRRTQKNEVSYQNALRMAASFGLEFAELETSADHSGASSPSEADQPEESGTTADLPPATTPRPLPAGAVHALYKSELGDFLRATRPQLNESVFENWNLPAADLDRWFRALN